MKRYGIYEKKEELPSREVRRSLVNKKVKTYDHRGQVVKGSRFKPRRTRRIN